jgi:hypothetical protein
MAYELIISDPGANMTYVLAHTDGSRTLVQGKSRICLSRSELRRLNESADRSESPGSVAEQGATDALQRGSTRAGGVGPADIHARR